MTSVEFIDEVCSNFKNLVKKPEIFLSLQDHAAENTKLVLKKLYDFLKSQETIKSCKTLPELTIDGFDEEQIWQEIDLQNEDINDVLVKDVAHLLAKKNRLNFEVESLVEDDAVEAEDDESDDVEEQKEKDLEGSDDSEEMSEESDLDIDESDKDENDDFDEGPKFSSEVDDDFFKLSEMESYCDKIEKEEEGKRKKGIPIDFFGGGSDNEDDENRLIRFNDFFKTPGKSKKADKAGKKDRHVDGKRVKFAEVDFEESGPNLDGLEKNVDLEEDGIVTENDGPKSSFEGRQERLKARIESLEEEALKEKPWFLKGEVTSGNRPQNSLLEEYVEFDLAARPAPIFTEKTTMRLEDIIKQRIKDKAWDDVPRKVKPVDDIREYKKQLVLDQEKSKLSLAEIYEQEYVKKRDAASADPSEPKPDEEPTEHREIKKMMKSLFAKLDALSNFHYTPKPVEPEVKIITNTPAIHMEEVAPIGTSDAALLAPEEVKNKSRGELMDKRERTTTDKKRERRKKKIKQRVRQKEKEKKEKLLNKMSLGLGNKYSKEKARKTLDNLAKEKNIDKMVETQSKHLKSSSAFFSQLENEVKSQVKRKAPNLGTKTKKLENFSAKKIKL